MSVGSVAADEIITAIREEKEPHHDIVYCTSDVKSALKRNLSRGIVSSSSMFDAVRIDGLHVQEIPRPISGRSVAIVCEHGEVFPLAGHYK